MLVEINEGLIVPLTMALVQGVKSIDDKGKLKKYYFMFSLGFSLILSFLFSYHVGTDWFNALIFGLYGGLVSSGLYNIVKK